MNVVAYAVVVVCNVANVFASNYYYTDYRRFVVVLYYTVAVVDSKMCFAVAVAVGVAVEDVSRAASGTCCCRGRLGRSCCTKWTRLCPLRLRLW